MKKLLLEDYLVCSDISFAIEWYFSGNGKSQAADYFKQLDRDQRLDAFGLFLKMAERGKIANITKFRYEGDGIYSFKPKPNRFVCFFFSGKKIIITNAFEKKKDKLPPREKKKALDCWKDYEARVNRGDYYE